MIHSGKKHLKLVVVGRSGAGKTTFINMMTNLILGKSYEDERSVAITQGMYFKAKDGEAGVRIAFKCNIPQFMHLQSDNVNAGQLHAQTQKCNMYDFSTDEFDLTLIDTPGLGDTRGIEQDKENAKHIVNAVAAVGEFHGILLVHKASDSRLDASFGYMINGIKELLTKECKDNIVIMFTHTSNSAKVDSLEALQQMGIPTQNTFTFENDCIVPPEMVKQFFENNKKFTTYKNTSSTNWESNQLAFEDFVEIMYKLLPRQGAELKALHSSKTVLYQVGFSLADKVKEIADKADLVTQMKVNIESFKQQAENNKAFNYVDTEQIARLEKTKVPRIVKQKVPKNVQKTVNKQISTWADEPLPAGQKNTMCLSCNNICHAGCGIEFQTADGGSAFKGCWAFNGNSSCRQCNHDFTHHAHRRFGRVQKTTTVPVVEWVTEMVDEDVTVYDEVSNTVYDQKQVAKVNQQMKDRYDQAQRDILDADAQINAASKDLDALKKKKDSYLKMIAYLYKSIATKCMHPINDYFEKHIEICKESIDKDAKLTTAEKKSQIQILDKNLAAYRVIKDVVMNNQTVTLDAYEQKELDDSIKKVEAEEEDLYIEYSDCRKKHRTQRLKDASKVSMQS
jgi:predicted GTPase